MKHYWVVPAILVAGGCGKVNPVEEGPVSCTIACSTDAECPTDFTCTDLGLCAKSGETCSCNADQFIACDAENALFCNSSANGVATESCGAAGCNTDAKRCNTCAPDAVTCNTEMTGVDTCGSDGIPAQSETCGAGCVADSGGAHCGHIQPAWLPDVCDDPATTPSATLSGTLSTGDAASCTGGTIEVNNQMFCVVRAGTISIADLKVTGNIPIAFVADASLMVVGMLDVSADATTSGPGGFGPIQGGTTLNSGYQGGGGGGFAQAGGAGGGTANGNGSPGGGTSDRPTTARFVGGSRGGNSICGQGLTPCLSNNVDFSGGGGGGGALLIACRGTVSVNGTIDAGGGGGAGGGDHVTTTATPQAQGGGAGGGAGGFVVFQGAQVHITGSLYANGGGGGAACGTDNCRGLAGSDGLRSTTGAPGGDAAGNTLAGGVGGSLAGPPGPGEATFSTASAGAGGGGGSMGRFEVFTPAGVTPMLTPGTASPAPVASTTSLVVE